MKRSSQSDSQSLAGAARQLSYALGQFDSLDEAFDKLHAVGDARQRAAQARLRTLLQSPESSNSTDRTLRGTPYSAIGWLLQQSKDPAASAASLLLEFRRHESFTHSARNLIKTNFSGFLQYLIAVLLIMVIVTVLYGLFVLPGFKSLYEGIGGSLPAFTRAVFFEGSLILAFTVAFSAFALGFLSWFTFLLRRRLSQFRPIPAHYEKIPLVGPVAESYRNYLWLSYVVSLRSAGVPTADALQLAGDRLDTSLRATSLAADLEIATKLNRLDEEITFKQDESADSFLSALDHCRYRTRLLLTACIYFLVGTVVSGMYLPIFALGSNI